MHEGNGILIGLVKDLDDPDRLGRVRVVFPTLDDQESYWVRMAAPMAGPERGFFMRPEVDDEVLVVLRDCSPLDAYILGGVWSKPDKPPPDDGKPVENNWRFMRSRSGHIFKFDDTNGAEKVEIIDKDEVTIGISRKIVLDPVNKKIQVICDDGDVEVLVRRGNVKVETNAGNVSVDATGDIALKATGKISLEGATVEIKATATMNAEAGGVMTIEGATVNIN
ncbi:MAG: phage baseplate assembly protein V [Chloroflexales bacterium]|nr:phage baseplate assembly protein V [Chloroflexales bacterium]